MSSLPLSVRTALWVTAVWHGHGGLTDLDEAVAAAHPDFDHVEGDLGRLLLWRELGESALLVALPRPGDLSGMPRVTPEVAGAAAAATSAIAMTAATAAMRMRACMLKECCCDVMRVRQSHPKIAE